MIDRLSHDLRGMFSDLKGFSVSHLKYMRVFAGVWPQEAIGQQPVGQLPWGHNIVLLTELKDVENRLACAAATVEHGWSRNVLTTKIEAQTLERQGRATTDFDLTWPAAQSDLARETIKDPYKLDFLGLENDAKEREIEQALVAHVADFLIE